MKTRLRLTTPAKKAKKKNGKNKRITFMDEKIGDPSPEDQKVIFDTRC